MSYIELTWAYGAKDFQNVFVAKAEYTSSGTVTTMKCLHTHNIHLVKMITFRMFVKMVTASENSLSRNL